MFTTAPPNPPPQVTTFSPAVQRFLAGRLLLATELLFPQAELEIHADYITQTPGLSQTGKRWLCTRCGNQTKRLFAKFPCANCQSDCTYCRKCLMMGRVSSCTPLYRWIGPPPELPPGKSPLQWDGRLSQGQLTASDAVANTIGKKEELLVWAVCGAGKTEVLFHGIERALQEGLRVLIATPRTDVVLELAPRLQKVFPSIQVAALYGGTEDRHVYSQLTISTTHQLLRFEHAFDLVIVDEVDAFPYSFDPSLKWAVNRAAKEGASRIYLTATPSRDWQIECRYGKRNFVKIPARFHRKPLPLPRFQWCGNWQKKLEKEKLPKNVQDWVKKRLDAKKGALLFFPRIDKMEKALPILRKLHPDIESVHAEDPLRKEKVAKMRKGDIPILLTTTILERGVTFPNIEVAIIGAEDDIFTEAALVQIAGRAGRSALHPKGDVVFFHFGRTSAMIRALAHMDAMNKEAQKAGLLDE